METHASQSIHRRAELQRVAVQAAEWLVSLEDGTTEVHEALADWLLESPLHTHMFLRAAAIDRHVASLHPTVLKALMDQMEREPASNILPWAIARAAPADATRQQPRRKNSALAACVAALAVGVVSALWWYQAAGPGSWEAYVTNVGDQRSISLQDGSIVHLNTRSRIDVRYLPGTREIRLTEGEALFKVHHDPSRPFRVHVDHATIQAIGTQFNVYRRLADTTVTVIEGAIQISQDRGTGGSATHTGSDGDAPTQPQRLLEGQAATVTNNGRLEKRGVTDVSQAMAWRQRQLVFERASLEDIAMEFNRYNRAPRLRVDERLAGRDRYTAVFDADNPQLLLQFLERDPSLTLVAHGDELVIEPREHMTAAPSQ